jgi:S-adenosylmethionine synthetase
MAYGIGQFQPEMVTAVTQEGKNLDHFVREKFPDLSPAWINEYLGLQHPDGWSYCSTAAFGHYGRGDFPWERIVSF